MTTNAGDTSPDALRLMTALYARMTPAEKLARVRDLTLSVNRLALARARALNPEVDEGALLLDLARRRLGDAIVDRAYGASQESDGS